MADERREARRVLPFEPVGEPREERRRAGMGDRRSGGGAGDEAGALQRAQRRRGEPRVAEADGDLVGGERAAPRRDLLDHGVGLRARPGDDPQRGAREVDLRLGPAFGDDAAPLVEQRGLVGRRVHEGDDARPGAGEELLGQRAEVGRREQDERPLVRALRGVLLGGGPRRGVGDRGRRRGRGRCGERAAPQIVRIDEPRVREQRGAARFERREGRPTFALGGVERGAEPRGEPRAGVGEAQPLRGERGCGRGEVVGLGEARGEAASAPREDLLRGCVRLGGQRRGPGQTTGEVVRGVGGGRDEQFRQRPGGDDARRRERERRLPRGEREELEQTPPSAAARRDDDDAREVERAALRERAFEPLRRRREARLAAAQEHPLDVHRSPPARPDPPRPRP